MKTRYFMMAMLLYATSIVQAQDTYLNDRVTATDDLNGTARYVGMGGALGALGADISVIGSNPAGIGLYRKNEVGLTFGAVVPTGGKWDSNQVNGEKLAKGSFDQIGLVWSLKIDGDKLKYVNFAANYQKKANYNQGFFADNSHLGGLSQMDVLAELATGNGGNSYGTDYNLAGLAAVPDLNDASLDNYYLQYDATGKVYSNPYSSTQNKYARHQWGALQAFDFNASFNVKDRFYTGASVGMDNINYHSWSDYMEYKVDGFNYSLHNNREISGYGVNVKLGVIVRPIEDNPFRFGITMETPTWYRLHNSTYFQLDKSQEVESYLETTVRTPWRGRVSLGSTLDKILAWGVEYEFANPSKTKMGYPNYYNSDTYSSFSGTADFDMNQHTKNTLRGQHTLRLGLEVKPIDELAIRVGYNFISNRYKDNPSFDQFLLHSSPAMDYETSTDFMTLGATNIVTFGLGYKYKKFFADIAYKYRMQNAKFYAFDTSFTSSNQFVQNNPTLAGATIAPVDVDLNRHQVQLSLGFKF